MDSVSVVGGENAEDNSKAYLAGRSWAAGIKRCWRMHKASESRRKVVVEATGKSLDTAGTSPKQSPESRRKRRWMVGGSLPEGRWKMVARSPKSRRKAVPPARRRGACGRWQGQRGARARARAGPDETDASRELLDLRSGHIRMGAAGSYRRGTTGGVMSTHLCIWLPSARPYVAAGTPARQT